MTQEERVERYGDDLCMYCRECDHVKDNPCQHKIDAMYGYKDGFIAGAKDKEAEINELGLALQSDMDRTIEQNLSLKKQTVNKWHFVKDGDLPENTRSVLVYTEDEKFSIDFYSQEIEDWNINLPESVFAWCELPLPPVEEK